MLGAGRLRLRRRTVLRILKTWNALRSVPITRPKPFRPFTFAMGDGRSFTVSHLEFLSRSALGRTIIIYGDDDNFNVLDLLLLTELEVLRRLPERATQRHDSTAPVQIAKRFL